MAGKQTRGRQRILISRIQNRDDMYATFSKRRLGLYKKASELSNICGVNIGIIMFSPTNVPYSFFHPNMESVVNRYRNPNQPQDAYTRIVESTTRSNIDALNRRLDEIQEEKQALQEKNKYLEEIERTRQKGWWEETPIESLNMEQVNEQINWFKSFKSQVESRIEQLQNGASTSAPDTGIDQFPSNYYGIPDLAHDPSYANENGHLFSQYFLPQEPSTAGGSGHNSNPFLTSMSSHEEMDDGNGDVPSHYMYPQPPQDPSGGGGRCGQVSTGFFNTCSSLDLSSGGRCLTPNEFFLSAPPLNPSGSVGIDPISGRYRYVHPQTQNPSTAEGSGAANSGDQGHGGN